MANMKIDIVKNRISKIVLTIFCLLILTYNQYGYADMRKYLYKDEVTGREYVKITIEDAIVTSAMAEGIAYDLANRDHPVGSLQFTRANFLSGTFATIMQAVQLYHTLREFDLEGNSYSDIETEQVLVEALRPNTDLYSFTLAGYLKRSTEFWTQLADVLSNRGNLTELTLIDNSIGTIEAEVEAIIKILRTNRSLMTIGLIANVINDDGALRIVKALKLKENRAVTGIALNLNKITTVGWQAIIEALAYNTTIQDMDLDESLLPEQREIIGFILQRNLLIQELPDELSEHVVVSENGLNITSITNIQLPTEAQVTVNEIVELQNDLEGALTLRGAEPANAIADSAERLHESMTQYTVNGSVADTQANLTTGSDGLTTSVASLFGSSPSKTF